MGRRPGPPRRDHRNTEWMEQAACAAAPTELFYPDPPEEWPAARRTPENLREYHLLQERAIEDYCGDCPVREACGEYGADEEFGIWGGLTEVDRRARLDSHRTHRSGLRRDRGTDRAFLARLRSRQAHTLTRLIGA